MVQFSLLKRHIIVPRDWLKDQAKYDVVSRALNGALDEPTNDLEAMVIASVKTRNSTTKDTKDCSSLIELDLWRLSFGDAELESIRDEAERRIHRK